MATSEKFVITPRTSDPAVRLVGASERRRDLTGSVRRAQLVPSEHRPGGDARRPGTSRFEQSRFEGEALGLDQAVAYASRGRGSHSRAQFGWESLTVSRKGSCRL